MLQFRSFLTFLLALVLAARPASSFSLGHACRSPKPTMTMAFDGNAAKPKAFSTFRRIFGKSRKSPLFYQNGNEYAQDLQLPLVIESVVVVKSSTLNVYVNPLELPKHSPSKEVVARAKFLLNSEMALGRIAMIAAVLLLVGEVVTGLSITDQITSLL
jgi:hypothetical protein